ncbi:MAG TPA: hypothetical protein DEA55_02635 [Rhodospirillaceae bacterium]|nr:hypothetical protein [Rhodospirillaceae bacterium]
MKRVVIIGGGLAGTACAYVLKQAGAEPVIYEAGAELAPGASGNPVGLYNPRLSAFRTPESDFYAGAFALALRVFEGLNDIDWNPCGALHLMTDEKRQKRFEQAAQSWGWPPENMRLLNAGEASEVAGIEIKYDALYLPQSGTVSPKKLCERYAQGVEVHLNKKIDDIAELKADAVIVAGGMGVKDFFDLPLKAVRGQITQAKPTEISKRLKCCLCYGGYVTPVSGNVHTVGATFQRWLDHSDVMPQDDADNIKALAAVVPELAQGMEVTGGRAALRTTAPDHFPVVGKLKDNVYVSTAHGSHGILSALAAAHLLADMILGRPLSLPGDVVGRLSPGRF